MEAYMDYLAMSVLRSGSVYDAKEDPLILIHLLLMMRTH